VYGVHDGLLRNLGMTINAMTELSPKMQATLKRYEEEKGVEMCWGRNWLPK
jgi:hypothetical protein